MPDPAIWAIAWLGAYLLGGVPFGLLIGKARGLDIRAHGSGNIGATNAMRVLGKGPGSLCFALDVAKGAAPVLIAGLASGLLTQGVTDATDAGAWIGVGAAAILGHLFSPYLGFKGGKGVATGFGVFVAYWGVTTLPALAALLVWIALAKLTRYVSVASMGAALTLPIATAVRISLDDAWDTRWPFMLATGLIAGFVIVKHRGNVRRLMKGTESRIGAPKPGGPPPHDDTR